MNISIAVKEKPPAKKRLPVYSNSSTPLENAFQDSYDFIYGKKGQEERKDFDFAKSVDADYAGQLYTGILDKETKRRGLITVIDKILKAVKNKTWSVPLPSGKDKTYFKFNPTNKKDFTWKALSLIELPSTISRHRGRYGHLYLAVEYLDIFQGIHAPQSKVGSLDQWSLFVAHAFDRYSERVLKRPTSRTEALSLFAEASLAAEGKALIEDNEGRVIYAIKTKDTCIYFMGYAKFQDDRIFRFFKTIISEPMLRYGQRKHLTRLKATSDTWTDEAASWSGWDKLPIVGAP